MSRYGLARLLAVAVALGGTACSKPASNVRAAPGRRSDALVAPYVPPSTWHGDGATNDGAGGWTTSAAGGSQCLSCHDGRAASDMTPYLRTGHKNVLRKVTRGTVLGGADGRLLSSYFTNDSPQPTGNSLYGSGSTFDWGNGLIRVGSGPPTIPYSSANPNPLAGTQQDLFYVFGGWSDFTALDTIFRGGFTGEQFPAGNYDCARCHTTGYRFDDSGAEPTFNGVKISPAELSRIPTDFACSDGVSASYAACVANGGTATSASWMLDGIQCERCHNADLGHASTGDPSQVTKPVAESATALCLQCHREENVDTGNNVISLGGPCSDGVTSDYAGCVATGNAWTSDLIVYDGGSCSDGVSPDYGTCVATPGNTWSFAPFFDHESGGTFLNGPHARFSGALSIPNQNSSDMTVAFNGTFNSTFTDATTGGNAGCTGCHDPHQSSVAAVGAAKPFVKKCADCHATLAQRILSRIAHPLGAGSPFGGIVDISDACAVCHMSQSYHLLRISTDAGYSTFPTAAQIYAAGGQAAPNTAPDGKLGNAVWSDADLACGQCHAGSGLLPGQPGVAAISKSTLAWSARCIHHEPVVHTKAGANGVISPPGTTFVADGGTATLAFNPNAGFEVKSITVDGKLMAGPRASYTFANVVDCHTVEAQFGPPPAITASVSGGGSISPAGAVAVPTGASQTFTMTPSPGYVLQSVIIDLATNVGPVTSYTFSNVGGNHTINAIFTAIPPPPQTTFTLHLGASGPGTITNSLDGTVVRRGTSSQVVARGATVTYTFNPDSGYKVGYLVVNGTSVPVATSYTFSNVQFPDSLNVSFLPLP